MTTNPSNRSSSQVSAQSITPAKTSNENLNTPKKKAIAKGTQRAVRDNLPNKDKDLKKLHSEKNVRSPKINSANQLNRANSMVMAKHSHTQPVNRMPAPLSTQPAILAKLPPSAPAPKKLSAQDFENKFEEIMTREIQRIAADPKASGKAEQKALGKVINNILDEFLLSELGLASVLAEIPSDSEKNAYKAIAALKKKDPDRLTAEEKAALKIVGSYKKLLKKFQAQNSKLRISLKSKNAKKSARAKQAKKELQSAQETGLKEIIGKDLFKKNNKLKDSMVDNYLDFKDEVMRQVIRNAKL